MKNTSATIYKAGSIGEFAAWTRRVVCDPKAAREFPKKWFASEEAAARAEQVSADAMVRNLEHFGERQLAADLRDQAG